MGKNMAKKLYKGGVFHFYYQNWKEDPYPVVLILYVGELVHAINLSYLPAQLSDLVVNMLASISLGKLQGQNTYWLYHSYIKKNMPRVVRMAYRTYKKEKIKNPILVTQGFDATKMFLTNKRIKATKNNEQVVKQVLKKAIRHTKKTKDENVEWKKKRTSQRIEDIEKNVDTYMKKVNEILKNREEYLNLKNYTKRLNKTYKNPLKK